ncbi:hypothetical protein BH10CYA1_BH10CYA1_25980 [soil metagenome]
MTLRLTENIECNKFEGPTLMENPENSQSTSLASSKLGDVRRLSSITDLSPGLAPKAHIGEHGEMLFCSTPMKDSKDTPEQRVEQKIKDSFGADVFDHLKDWDWLIENRKKLEDGFKKADNQTAWDMAQRMRDLSKVDGKSLIYLSKLDGPTRGNLIPKTYEIYLRRGSFRSDDYIGRVSH